MIDDLTWTAHDEGQLIGSDTDEEHGLLAPVSECLKHRGKPGAPLVVADVVGHQLRHDVPIQPSAGSADRPCCPPSVHPLAAESAARSTSSGRNSSMTSLDVVAQRGHPS